MLIGPLPPAQFDAAIQLWHDAGLTRPWNDPYQDLRRAIVDPASNGTDHRPAGIAGCSASVFLEPPALPLIVLLADPSRGADLGETLDRRDPSGVRRTRAECL